jgi:hypothetical protein
MAASKRAFSPTPEMLDKARAARTAGAAERAKHEELFKPSDTDDNIWAWLAKQRGFRLPQRGTAVTTAGIEKYLKLTGMSPTKFKMWHGFKGKLGEWCHYNAHFSMRALAGLLLEETYYKWHNYGLQPPLRMPEKLLITDCSDTQDRGTGINDHCIVRKKRAKKMLTTA